MDFEIESIFLCDEFERAKESFHLGTADIVRVIARVRLQDPDPHDPPIFQASLLRHDGSKVADFHADEEKVDEHRWIVRVEMASTAFETPGRYSVVLADAGAQRGCTFEVTLQ